MRFYSFFRRAGTPMFISSAKYLSHASIPKINTMGKNFVTSASWKNQSPMYAITRIPNAHKVITSKTIPTFLTNFILKAVNSFAISPNKIVTIRPLFESLRPSVAMIRRSSCHLNVGPFGTTDIQSPIAETTHEQESANSNSNISPVHFATLLLLISSVNQVKFVCKKYLAFTPFLNEEHRLGYQLIFNSF